MWTFKHVNVDAGQRGAWLQVQKVHFMRAQHGMLEAVGLCKKGLQLRSSAQPSSSIVPEQDKLPDRPLSALAARTEHFSGSDLYELCAEAASVPLNDFTEAL